MLLNTQYTETIEKVGGYYNFITCINRRLKELRNGADPMVQPNGAGEDMIDLVVREIEAGHLHFHLGSNDIEETSEVSY